MKLCYKTFYRGNLPPFHSNTVILCYKAIIPWKLLWNISKLLWYFNLEKLGYNYRGKLPWYLFYNIGYENTFYITIDAKKASFIV